MLGLHAQVPRLHHIMTALPELKVRPLVEDPCNSHFQLPESLNSFTATCADSMATNNAAEFSIHSSGSLPTAIWKGHAHAMGSYITSAAGRADAAGGREHLVPADAELADAGGHERCAAVRRPRSRPGQLPPIHNALPRHHRPLVQFFALLRMA